MEMIEPENRQALEQMLTEIGEMIDDAEQQRVNAAVDQIRQQIFALGFPLGAIAFSMVAMELQDLGEENWPQPHNRS